MYFRVSENQKKKQQKNINNTQTVFLFSSVIIFYIIFLISLFDSFSILLFNTTKIKTNGRNPSLNSRSAKLRKKVCLFFCFYQTAVQQSGGDGHPHHYSPKVPLPVPSASRSENGTNARRVSPAERPHRSDTPPLPKCQLAHTDRLVGTPPD